MHHTGEGPTTGNVHDPSARHCEVSLAPACCCHHSADENTEHFRCAHHAKRQQAAARPDPLAECECSHGPSTDYRYSGTYRALIANIGMWTAPLGSPESAGSASVAAETACPTSLSRQSVEPSSKGEQRAGSIFFPVTGAECESTFSPAHRSYDADTSRRPGSHGPIRVVSGQLPRGQLTKQSSHTVPA